MLINLRNALMTGKRLPYDAEVEYLESTGTQWIDTGYSFNSATDKVELVFELLTTTPIYKWIFGAYDSQKRLAIGSGSAQARRTLGYNASTSYNSSTYYTDGAHIFLADSTGASIDGHNFSGFADFSTTSHILLYTIPLNPSTYCSNSRIWSYKHYRNGVLVRDYIPVRKGTVGYMYDRVSKRLFGNAGTGDFVVGQDVVPVEYIESHGTEYIDTGVPGRDGYDFEYRFRPLNPLPCGIGGEYENNQSCYIGLVRSNGYLAYNYSNPNVIVEVQSLTLGTDYNVKAHLYSGEQYFEVNGVRGGVGSRTGVFTSSYNLYLFAINSANQPTNLGTTRLYNFTAHLNTIPTRSLRPVRVGTEGAMMDVLTRRIYRNAGAGAFTYGNDLKYPIPAS